MKKELVIHLFCFIVFFALLTLVKQLFQLPTILLWVGGLVGTLLPDIDHLIYIYFLQPQELTSQRVQTTLQKGNVGSSVNLLLATREERTNLIFHNAWFQLLFLVLTFWVVTSSSSLLGKGIVLAFSLHLLVDQFVDLSRKGNIDQWLSQVKISLTREKATVYCVFLLIVVVTIGLFL